MSGVMNVRVMNVGVMNVGQSKLSGHMQFDESSWPVPGIVIIFCCYRLSRGSGYDVSSAGTPKIVIIFLSRLLLQLIQGHTR